MNTKPIYVSQTDSLKLRLRLPAFAEHKRFREAAHQLKAELDRAIIVNDDALSDDIVALDSFVSIQDLESGELEDYTLTLPELSDAALNRISVFSPLGTAMLGYAAGDEFSWSMPGGLRRLRIVAVSPPGVPAVQS